MSSVRDNRAHDREVVLAGRGIRITLSAAAPCVVQYESTARRAVLGGGPIGREPSALICRLSDRSYTWTHDPPWRVQYAVHRSSVGVRYRASISEGEVPAVEFDLRFTAKRDEMEIAFENVHESPGYELLTVRTAPPISVSAEQPNASLIIPTQAGRRIPVADCPAHEETHTLFWLHPVPLAMVCHDGLVGMLATTSPDDRLLSAVEETENGSRRGQLSVEFTYRMKAAPPAAQFVVHDSSRCRVILVSGRNGRRCDWTVGAARWRREVKAKLNPLYTRAWVYKIYLDTPGAEAPRTTFDQALQLIRRVNRLTDGARQIVYLVGWQHEGHDSRYPDVFTVNERVGGLEGLRHLVAEAERLNCIVSFHDNYDDAYMDSPAWDPDLIARDASGQLMKGGVWAGGQSYIISPARYAGGAAGERIRRTLQMYPIRRTYHLDVLSAEALRYDFRSDDPASALRCLQGKWRIIEEFNRHGVDVTSEGLSAPFVGHIGYALHLLRGRGAVYPVEERIPLVPFIYHGSITYGGGGERGDPPVLDALLYGATFGSDRDADTTDVALTDTYYLVVLPATLLAKLPMAAYEENGDARIVRYGSDTYVEVNEREQRYRVVFKGRLLAQDFATLVPVSRSRVLAYSRSDGQVRFPAPDGWTDAAAVRVHDLLEGRAAEPAVTIERGEICLTVSAGHPYRLRYSRSREGRRGPPGTR